MIKIISNILNYLLKSLVVIFVVNVNYDAQTNPANYIQSDSCSITQIGQIVFHKGDKNIAYDWFSYIPTTINKSNTEYILITGLHGNKVTDNYDEITTETKEMVINESKRAEKNNYIICIPVIPRPQTDYVYTVAFPRKVFINSTDSFCQRPDLKVNLMIDKIISNLSSEGYNIFNKVLLYGHSAGAMFVQRYALLHPKRVIAFVAGQCGGAITLPIAEYDNTRLDWPAGVNDFSTLAGSKFDFELYKKIKQMYYIGEYDTLNSTLVRVGELWDSQNQIDFLNNTFGQTDPVRLEKQINLLTKLGCDAVFKKYPNMAHQRTKEIFEDMFKFFNNEVKNNSFD
ncbi:MAG: alpha/beta hydrolase [bacterium]